MQENLLPEELTALVRAELRSGERITWASQPIAGRLALPGLGTTLVGIPFTAFALFWIAGASGFKRPDFSNVFGFFPLFGVPFVLIGLVLLTTPLRLWRQARRTAYVITNTRVMILARGFRGTIKVRTFEPSRLGEIRRVQKADGSGDVTFERVVGSKGRVFDQGFLGVRDARRVETLIRDLNQAAGQR